MNNSSASEFGNYPIKNVSRRFIIGGEEWNNSWMLTNFLSRYWDLSVFKCVTLKSLEPFPPSLSIALLSSGLAESAFVWSLKFITAMTSSVADFCRFQWGDHKYGIPQICDRLEIPTKPRLVSIYYKKNSSWIWTWRWWPRKIWSPFQLTLSGNHTSVRNCAGWRSGRLQSTKRYN